MPDKNGKEKYFISPGAVSRGAYNDENIDRIPKVVIIESKEGVVSKIIPVRLNVRPKEEVFDVEKLERLKEKDREISKFTEELAKSQSEDESVTVDEAMGRLEIAKEVKLQIEYYLSKADTDGK